MRLGRLEHKKSIKKTGRLTTIIEAKSFFFQSSLAFSAYYTVNQHNIIASIPSHRCCAKYFALSEWEKMLREWIVKRVRGRHERIKNAMVLPCHSSAEAEKPGGRRGGRVSYPRSLHLTISQSFGFFHIVNHKREALWVCWVSGLVSTRC